MTDARFEDAEEGPLRLIAQDVEGLSVLSTLLQDAIFPITEMTYAAKRHRFAMLLNRFRWEDRDAAERQKRGFERVQSLLVFEDVLTVKTQGIDRKDSDTVLSLLSITFIPSEFGAGQIEIILAGDGAIALQIEALDATLRDVSRPYLAPSRQVPTHEE
ncbi:MAG: DUF2948 family protein [bacterium]